MLFRSTLGGGGHGEAILKASAPDGVLIGIDRDEAAIEHAKKVLQPYNERVIFVRADFADIKEVLIGAGFTAVDGILLDLGVSSYQLDEASRGFSFRRDAPLDMRMDRDLPLTAGDIVNKWSERDIERILREYGEERKALQIAREIVRQRKRERIETCLQLAAIVERVYRRRGRTHPATKTFQALRIAVNDELNQLSEGLSNALKILEKGGRLCVITYHSLEDRIVKRFILAAERQEGALVRLNKKPIIPLRDEQRRNPSSRSAKLRGAEKL